MVGFTWLPPLGGPYESETDVFISQCVPGSRKRSGNRPLFNIKLVADVDFASIDEGKGPGRLGITGLAVNTHFQIPFSDVSSVRLKTEIRDRTSIRITGIICFTETHVGQTDGMDDEEIAAVTLYERLANFFIQTTEKGYNRGAQTIDLKIYIRQDFWIPKDELESWHAWYQEKKRAVPNFEHAYERAIARPRTEDEEERAAFLEMEETHVLGLEEVRFSDLGLCTSCSICYNDFHSESKLRKLYCDHVFDEACIKKWLKQANCCPLCRFNE